jgi:predicted lysophospholipase L1 biosynthesis ABC-type transport system permease subunit
VTAVIAALLGLIGLVLAIRSTLSSERAVLAEYEALGVPRSTLGRSLQTRVAALSIFGIVAALVGGAVAVLLLSAFVAVTGSAERPLPPIEGVIAWREGIALLTVVLGLALLAAVTFSRRALSRSTGGRLRG